MSLRLPSGRIVIRNQTAESCAAFLRERFQSVRKGEVPLKTVEVGRVDGRIHHDCTFTMSYRLAHLVHSGALVVVGKIEDVTEGCVITYHTRIQRVTLAFWIIWIVALLAVIVLSLGAPDSASTSRVMLSTVIVLLVPGPRRDVAQTRSPRRQHRRHRTHKLVRRRRDRASSRVTTCATLR